MRCAEGMAGRHTPAWEPCAADEFCYSPSLAASLVNTRMPHLWSSTFVGFVVAPAAVAVRCAFHGDGASSNRHCSPAGSGAASTCVPGCRTPSTVAGWCDPAAKVPLEDAHCAWSPEHLEEMMHAFQSKLQLWAAKGVECAKGGGSKGRGRCHNEVVLDAQPWMENLPHTVEAIFYQRGSDPKTVAAAAGLREQFLRRYYGGVSSTTDLTPLVVYDDAHLQRPFSLAPVAVPGSTTP